jgi:hypothetical protein
VDAVAEIRAAQERELVDEDGDRVELVLGPAVTAEEIERMEGSAGLPFPVELRELLAFTRSIEGPLHLIDFTGEPFEFESELFPSGLAIAEDGYGNFWVADLTPDSADRARVFFACHDPPVVLLQSESIAAFLHEAFRMLAPPHESLIDDVHEDRLFEVGRSNAGALTHDDALSGDATLAEFAAGLDERHTFYDLRAAPVGMGFAWGRHGPFTTVVRCGYEPIFAIARPERKPSRLRRLFGG